MDRLPGLTRAIHEAVPGELVPLLWLVTVLGSVKFLLVCLSVAYWSLNPHRETIRQLLAVVAVGFGVTLALKHWLALPRPPAELFRYPVEPTPYGFPSGHAVAATTLFGGAVVLVEELQTPKRIALAGALVVLVSVSRVALGIHYVGDVLAGLVVGTVVVGVATVVVRRRVVWGFALVAACSLPAIWVSGGSHNAVVVAGASFGAVVAAVWTVDTEPSESTTSPEEISPQWRLTATGILVVGVFGAVGRFVAVKPIALGAFFVAGVAIIALPSAFGRYSDSERGGMAEERH